MADPMPSAAPIPAPAAGPGSEAAVAAARDPAAEASVPQPSLLDHGLALRWSVPVLVLLLLLPAIAGALGDSFYVGVAGRILIFALAATSLNLVLGFGGMVSFGHAAFVGVGAYVVAILQMAGIGSAWVAWPLAVAASALLAALIGLVSLQTQGVYFIMITLAFAQMIFYLVVSLKVFGGEDGLPLESRSTIAPGLDLGDEVHLYFVALAVLVAVLVGLQRLLNAGFGHVLQGIRENETRMAAAGFPVLRCKLLAFTLSGAIAGLAGALLANQTGFVSPALLQWNQSGVLMIMVILGGVGHLYGGLAGAAAYLLIEEVLAGYTVHAHFWLGAILLAVVLRAPNGLLSLSRKRRKP